MSFEKKYISIQFFQWLAIALPLPILVLYQQSLGLSLSEVGFSAAMYSTAAIVFEIPLGYLSDKLGRIQVYRISILFNIIGFLLFASASSYLHILIAQFFLGIARAASSGTLDAWFVDNYIKYNSKQVPSKIWGNLYLWIHLGLMLGALFGGFFAHFDYKYTLYAATCMSVYLLCCAAKINNTPNPGSQTSFKLSDINIKNPTINSLLIVNMLYGVSFGALSILWQPFLKLIANGFTGFGFGLLNALYFFMGVIASKTFLYISAKMKDTRFLIYMRSFQTLQFILIAIFPNTVFFAISYLLVFFLSSSETPAFQKIYNSKLSCDTRSTMLSIESFSKQAGFLIGSILIGQISSHGYTASWIFCSLVLLLSIIPLMRIELKATKINSIKSQAG